MTDTAAALLTELIDHAGLFPPARLTMADALAADGIARRSASAALIGRFLCPASRLQELADALPGAGLPVGVVLDGDDPVADAAGVREFVMAVAGRARVELLEGQSAALVAAELADLLPVVSPFVELSWGADWAGALSSLPVGVGAKLRCGGLTPDSFPPVDAVAAALIACAATGTRLKATAGLHRAVRQLDPADGEVHHGFLNLVTAAVMAHAAGLDADALVPILADEDPSAFHLEDQHLRWRDLAATADEVSEARRALFVSYGSCTLTEPVEDLQTLGILPA